MIATENSLTARDQEILLDFCRLNRVERLSLFGSRARGSATPASDFDLLVRFSEPIGLYRHIELETELAEKLGREVDLVTESSLHRFLRERVMADVRVLYESR